MVVQSGSRIDLPVYPHQPVLRSVGFLQVRQIDIPPTNDGVAGPIEAGRITEVQLSVDKKENKGNELIGGRPWVVRDSPSSLRSGSTTTCT